MLIITRRIDETFLLYPDANLDPSMTVAELFARGPIEVSIIGVNGNQVRIGINASTDVHILRSEILPKASIPFDEADIRLDHKNMALTE